MIEMDIGRKYPSTFMIPRLLQIKNWEKKYFGICFIIKQNPRYLKGSRKLRNHMRRLLFVDFLGQNGILQNKISAWPE